MILKVVRESCQNLVVKKSIFNEKLQDCTVEKS